MNSTTTGILPRRPAGVDRRKLSDRQMSSDVARIRNEYVEMPGLVLTCRRRSALGA